MQWFSTIFGSWPPFVFSHNLRPFLLLFQYIWYYNHYDHHKTHFLQNATTITTLLPQKCILWLLISKGNWISQTFSMRRLTVQPYGNFEIRGWVFAVLTTNLLSCSTFLWFRAFILMWTKAEKPLSQRCVVANERNIRKASSDSCGNNSRTDH